MKKKKDIRVVFITFQSRNRDFLITIKLFEL